MEWAADNCYTLARRELRRLDRETVERGGTGMTPVSVAMRTWQHIIRICERAGCQGQGVLREASPSGGSKPVASQEESWTLRHDGPNGKGVVVLTAEEGAALVKELERLRSGESTVPPLQGAEPLREALDSLMERRGKPVLEAVRDRDRALGYQVGMLLDDIARIVNINSPNLPRVPLSPSGGSRS